MTIKEYQRSLEMSAEFLGDYTNLSKTELWNNYCDADEKDDAELAECYYCALLLRYFYKIWEWKKTSVSLNLPSIEFVHWLEDCVNDTLYYRSWRKLRHDHKAEKEVGGKVWIQNPQYVDDPNAADKSFNYFCAAKRGKEYQYHNKDVRKGNVQTYSLDSMIDDEGDYAIQFSGCVVNDYKEYNDPAYLLVSEFNNRQEFLEALVLEGMMNGDSFKTEKYNKISHIWDQDKEEYVEKECSYIRQIFDERKLVKYLSHLDEDYIYRFCCKYDVDSNLSQLIYKRLKNMPNSKLYTLIKKVTVEVKTDSYLRSFLVAA